MPWLHFKTDHALRRKENKVEFLEGRFLSFLHKKKAEHSLDLSFFIFCLLTVYFKPWNAELLSQNICMMIAQKPFCWKWISVTKVSKYGTSEYSRALNASYTRNFSRSKVHLPDLEVCCDCFFFLLKSADVRGAGTLDEPLRTSVREANRRRSKIIGIKHFKLLTTANLLKIKGMTFQRT